MSKNYFQIIRSKINTTFQDLGRKNLCHIGIPLVEQWIIEIIYWRINLLVMH